MSPSYNTMYWGTAPSTTCLKLWEFADPSAFKDILVLGVGDGRNATFLAQQGFNVTVVDSNAESMASFQGFAKEQGLNVNTKVLDVTKDDLLGPYNIIISVGFLHAIPKEMRKKKFEYLESITKPGGFHAMSAFVAKPFTDQLDFDAMESGELLSYYHPWRVHWSTQELFRSDTKKIYCVDRVIAQYQASKLGPDDITQPLGVI